MPSLRTEKIATEVSTAQVETVQERKRELKKAYLEHRSKKRAFALGLVPLAVLLSIAAIGCGTANIGFQDVYQSIVRALSETGNASAFGSPDIIIWKLRIPRIVMGLFTGIALGSSGAVMQVILKNPLADPYMLGIASAAGFGASLAIVAGIGIGDSTFLVIANAFLFAVLASVLILVLSGRKQASPDKMILTGLALLFFFQAMTTLIQYFGEAEAVKAAVFWTVGDLGKAEWWKILTVLPVVLIGNGWLILKARDLNIMNTGDSSARSLGVDVRKTRIIAMLICSLMVAAVISFTGTIGFIGLVAPHLVRMVAGNDNKVLIPTSGLVGAILLVLSDTVARSLLVSTILPVGAVTSFLGVPLFLFLIMRKNSEMT